MRDLPVMEGGWDDVFDETYLRTYLPILTEERAVEETHGALGLAGVSPGAEILDCPCGFARHAVHLVAAGYLVTGVDRSEVQLAEARARVGGAPWPRLVQADYRELPFPDESFDAVFNLFTSLGFLPREGDVAVLRELRRVLRPGAPLVVETMHRDRLARHFVPRVWDELGAGVLFLQERSFDAVAGTVATRHLLVEGDGSRSERSFLHRVYTAGEWTAMLHEAGFGEVEAFGGFDESPVTPDARLVLRAR